MTIKHTALLNFLHANVIYVTETTVTELSMNWLWLEQTLNT